MTLTNFVPNLVQTVAAGAAAGNVTVTGIKPQDYLLSVINLTDGEDITDEFTITAVNTINNTGGGTTATDTLLVLYARADAKGGDLNRG